MAGFGNLFQKAFYLGVGLASYAGEQAGEKLIELRETAQKLADELVERGEMNAEEARRFVEDMVNQGQRQANPKAQVREETGPKEPRRIEILDDDEEASETSATSTDTSTSDSGVEHLHQQVQSLQDELRRLQQDQ
ncbi:MAG: hypothetical protein EA395_15315 [Phormidium sp. GEM2.Bin31]|nr:hypothetical protein [Phormidium sp. BM_Day4_Bin.17]TVR05707.1 MAG: hypothetical protein EA395_15315 [Phormidium sp. GEM2.Bin31]UCJ12141.1 MAG: hypothetical protein JWS08_20980 [Phormidium sp. PBR-2020]